LISIKPVTNGPFTVIGSISVAIRSSGECCDRSDLSGGRRRRPPPLRRLRRPSEARIAMLMILLYAAGGVGIAIYMIAALLRPEKF
jgi:hypothetical protein